MRLDDGDITGLKAAAGRGFITLDRCIGIEPQLS
jgi:hypothetical protein